MKQEDAKRIVDGIQSKVPVGMALRAIEKIYPAIFKSVVKDIILGDILEWMFQERYSSWRRKLSNSKDAYSTARTR